MHLPELSWKAGFEIELMMPRGRSRVDLARRVAGHDGGTVARFFHPQSEPSQVPGRPTFENLTLGFRALGADGRLLASFVDDLTLQAGLERSTAPREGWYRIVSDDGRLLRLLARHADAESELEGAMSPLAGLFGTELERHEGGMLRVVDERRVSVAIGAPLPGERERPCEIVTAPIVTGHAEVLSGLLADAAAEGCTVPVESATHIHFDATAFESAPAIAALVDLLWRHGDGLKALVGFNPRCVRLGRWPAAVHQLTSSSAFREMAWPAAQAALMQTGLTKYCDYNLLNLASGNRQKYTVEIRVLPTWMEAAPLLRAAALFEGVLRWAIGPGVADAPVAGTLSGVIASLDLSADMEAYWLNRALTSPHLHAK